MKKRILSGVAVMAIATIAAFNLNLNVENQELSLLNLANVEALAEGEHGNDDLCAMSTITWMCRANYGYACYCE